MGDVSGNLLHCRKQLFKLIQDSVNIGGQTVYFVATTAHRHPSTELPLDISAHDRVDGINTLERPASQQEATEERYRYNDAEGPCECAEQCALRPPKAMGASADDQILLADAPAIGQVSGVPFRTKWNRQKLPSVDRRY